MDGSLGLTIQMKLNQNSKGSFPSIATISEGRDKNAEIDKSLIGKEIIGKATIPESSFLTFSVHFI